MAYTGYLVNLHESYVDESVYLYDNDYSAIVGSTCYSKINVITDMYSSKYIVASNNSFVNTRGTKIYMEDVRHGSSMTPLGGYYNIAASGNTVTCTGYSSYCGGSGIVIEGYRNTSTTGYCSAKLYDNSIDMKSSGYTNGLHGIDVIFGNSTHCSDTTTYMTIGSSNNGNSITDSYDSANNYTGIYVSSFDGSGGGHNNIEYNDIEKLKYGMKTGTISDTGYFHNNDLVFNNPSLTSGYLIYLNGDNHEVVSNTMGAASGAFYHIYGNSSTVCEGNTVTGPMHNTGGVTCD